MAPADGFVTLGDLLSEHGESEQDDKILERLKILAQKHLPEGWTQWEVRKISKENLLKDKPEAYVLDKLEYALPTVGIVRAFDTEAEHLSEMGYKNMKSKMLDWAFTRALIIGPPAIANQIRGSVVRTEQFKETIAPMRPMLHSRAEADSILSGGARQIEPSGSGVVNASGTAASTSRNQRAESQSQSGSGQSDEDRGSSDEETVTTDHLPWLAPPFSFETQPTERAPVLPLFTLDLATRVSGPRIPEPTPQIKKEGIDCQRLGSESWNRIRHKHVKEHLHASPVFSTLKVNAELRDLPNQPTPLMNKHEGMLGTITHGLLLQRKALLSGLNTIRNKFPAAKDELQKLLSDSNFKTVSDQLLQFVCGHRAEAIELRRKCFKGKNRAINSALDDIPPTATHLFDENRLHEFLSHTNDLEQIFVTKTTGSSRPAKRRQESWHTHPPSSTVTSTTSSSRSKRSRRSRD